jgi:hypothetical protein
MAYTKYSLTPANNNAAPPDGAPEGMLPSAVNDTMRDMMAQIRDVGDGIRDGTYPFTSGTVISANTSTDALRITQTGAGNALLVEDSTNPDSTPFVIDADGIVIVGSTTKATYGATSPSLQIRGTSTATSALSVESNSTTTTRGGTFYLQRSRSTTVGGFDSVQNNDALSVIVGSGADGTGFVQAAQIRIEVDGTPGTNDMPGRLVFSTTADGASSSTERLRIDSAGRVDMRNTMTDTGSGTASSISTTTLTVGGTVTGTFNVGDRIFGVGVEPNTFITALGTGTGGAGTYTINNSQTVASGTIRAVGGGLNTFRFSDTDTSATTNQPMGTIEWYGSDASTPNAGVKAYITAIAESTTPDTSLVFGTSDNIADIQAVERWRILSTGRLVASSGSGLSISATDVTSPAASDGNVFSGTYTPTQVSTNTNVTAVTYNLASYMRVGSIVTVSGRVDITATATGNTIVQFSLPIASAFTATSQGSGTGAQTSATVANNSFARLSSQSTDDCILLQTNSTVTTSASYFYTFTYRIL